MRVLIADDHDLLRDTLVLFLESEGGINASGAADLDQACKLIEAALTFDLILLDLNMPGMNGLDGLKRAMDMKNGQRVALMSGAAPRQIVEQALEVGAAGFIPKTMSAKSMINAVKFMALGEQYLPIGFMTAEPPEAQHLLAGNISPRELQVLRVLAEGKSNKEIARALNIAETTVKLHMKMLCRKLGVKNRTQAALAAQNAGLY